MKTRKPNAAEMMDPQMRGDSLLLRFQGDATHGQLERACRLLIVCRSREEKRAVAMVHYQRVGRIVAAALLGTTVQRLDDVLRSVEARLKLTTAGDVQAAVAAELEER